MNGWILSDPIRLEARSSKTRRCMHIPYRHSGSRAHDSMQSVPGRLGYPSQVLATLQLQLVKDTSFPSHLSHPSFIPIKGFPVTRQSPSHCPLIHSTPRPIHPFRSLSFPALHLLSSYPSWSTCFKEAHCPSPTGPERGYVSVIPVLYVSFDLSSFQLHFTFLLSAP